MIYTITMCLIRWIGVDNIPIMLAMLAAIMAASLLFSLGKERKDMTEAIRRNLQREYDEMLLSTSTGNNAVTDKHKQKITAMLDGYLKEHVIDELEYASWKSSL